MHTILIVESSLERGNEIASWLSDEGFEVLLCPGPSEPDYTCIGGKGKPCPLAIPSEVVILDMNLASDTIMSGTPAWELLMYYLQLGKRIVTLVGQEDTLIPSPEYDVEVVERPAGRDDILRAIHTLISRARAEAM